MKLHLGCGRNYLEGYINIDCTMKKQHVPGGVLKSPSLFMPEGDYRKQLQWLEFRVDRIIRIEELDYSPNSIEEIKCIHTLEHLSFRTAIRVLGKFHEFLEPGGLLNLEVPNAEELFFRFKGTSPQERQILYELIFCNQISPAEYHLSAWDSSTLSSVLATIGFPMVSVHLVNGSKPAIQVMATK